METRGTFAPETRADALEYYEEVGPVAQVVVREATKAMSFGADEYDERVTPEVIRTARDATFAEMLVVHVGEEGEFDDWLAESEFDEDDVVRIGSDNVEQRGVAPDPLRRHRYRSDVSGGARRGCQHPPPERVRPSVPRRVLRVRPVVSYSGTAAAFR